MSDLPTAMRTRQAVNLAIFMGPAVVLLLLFFITPVVVDLTVAFTDIGQTLKITEFTTAQFERMFTRDRRLSSSLALTLVYVFFTLAIFNVTFGLVLALVTTSVPDRFGAFFRSIWLLPRMSPSVVYALMWLWVVDPAERGLMNQILLAVGLEPYDMMNNAPMMLIVLANGFIGASMGMIIFTSAIRSIPEHLFHAARADGAGGLAIMWHVTLPAIRWPLSFITVYQTLSLLVSFEYIWLITVGGHTDTSGPAAYNAQLARIRADAVAKLLMDDGIDGAMLRVAAFGQTRPAVHTGDGVRNGWNRRVEIVVIEP